MFEPVRNHSSLLLLSSLVALGLLHGFFAGRAGENAVLPVVFLATLVAATAEAAPSGKLRLIAGGLAGLTFAGVVAVRWLHIEALLLAQWILLSTFLIFSAFRLLQKVLRPGSVSRAKLYDAVSIYLLLGLTWFALYNWTEQQAPGSFRVTTEGPSNPITPETLLYLSFTTLTTAGFGDVVAVRSVSPDARGRGGNSGSALRGDSHRPAHGAVRASWDAPPFFDTPRSRFNRLGAPWSTFPPGAEV